MSPQQYSASSVRQLAAVVDGMVGRVSEGRLRQLRMVVGMSDRAVGREEMPGRASRAAQQLFTWASLRAFWGLAVEGQLRHWERDVGKPLPEWTQRIVRDCLKILAREVLPAGKTVRLPSVANPEPKATVGGRSLDVLYRGMADLAGQGPLERDGTTLSYEDRTRLLAIVAVMLDAAPRSGELAAQSMAELATGEVAVAVRRRQQKASPNRVEEIAALAEVGTEAARSVLGGWVERVSEETRQRVLAAVAQLQPLPEVEWYPLREGSQVAVRRWLKVRQQLVKSLPPEGAETALWVSIVPSKAGPPGVPLRAQGLRQAYARGITALNRVMAGQHGWEPLPTTMEQVRRSANAVPSKELPAG
ncbi:MULTISPECIES: LacI family DNA-binding transcriptional regulator [unclassified Streptomyces]|uniref:LacI family DNA-binding transcriptional regulator n=1 Tax=unclassified Streptomyces TaxID=2593676 RepID=UPI0022589DC8|nr:MULTISPECIES: LacI family DNA-binding transcriptional regulator [unclassified Streptomyces]MCX4799862.1 LacI family DNA-binding transcriptional regulator [Streptomyces sp. NBC_01242]WSP67824.1 LacI family DNA-binding transcriptional regulator [Streptomyces sp. NBC_01240]